jgi:hypothetical protein
LYIGSFDDDVGREAGPEGIRSDPLLASGRRDQFEIPSERVNDMGRSKIKTGQQNRPRHEPLAPVSLNYGARANEMKRIMKENDSFLKRL